jgi:hypothetical protein
MPSRKVVEAREPFSVTMPDGSPLVVARGDRYYSDDPLVAGRPGLFVELTVKSSVPPSAPESAASVETATAAPGERRSLSRRQRSSDRPGEDQPSDVEE